jgi:hypothetical protein
MRREEKRGRNIFRKSETYEWWEEDKCRGGIGNSEKLDLCYWEVNKNLNVWILLSGQKAWEYEIFAEMSPSMILWRGKGKHGKWISIFVVGVSSTKTF